MVSDILFINRWISQCDDPSIMINSTCAILLDFYPQMFELENLRSTYIINCIFNVFLSCTTVMMNIATIYAFRKVSSLPQTLKTLLLSLAVSDVSVGLLGQPLYILTLIKWLQQNPPSCYIYRLLDLASILFAEASFLGVVVISVDRFLALHLHLRY